jgi:hypothetical protein
VPQARDTVGLKQNVVVEKANDRMLAFPHTLVSLAGRSADFSCTPDNLAGQPKHRPLDAQTAGGFVLRCVHKHDPVRLARLGG